MFEAPSFNGWQALPISGSAGAVTGSAVTTIGVSTTKIVYTLNGGRIFEAASNVGWRNLNSGVRGSTAAVLAVGNNKYIYAA